ncbi:MAG TPA: lipid-binding protein [Prolixibacteraceae bacterium]|nr:lipid-binding protein [Prolixibacteraceae bacterium]
MRKYLLYIAFLALVFSACDLKEDYVVEKSKVVEAAGQWWVNYVDSAGHESGYIALKTFNAAADDGTELWITDEGGFWDYKVKAAINLDGLTFSGTNLANASYDSNVDILNGKVFLNGGKSTSGVVTDSIAFDIVFSDSGADGETPELYKVYGHRRTGFLEDEH